MSEIEEKKSAPRNTNVRAALIDNYATVVVTLLVTVIVSRKLVPHDLGIFQLAALLTGLVSTLRDFGLTEYLVQEKNLTREKLRSALGLNILFSYGLGGLLFALSWPIAVWLREPAVGEVLRLLCINFALIPFGAVIMGLLRRELAFNKILWVSLASTLASTSITLYGVFAGWTYYSLAAGTITGTAVSVLAANLVRPKAVPRMPLFSGLLDQFKFGLYAVSIYGMGQVARVLPEQLIGRMLGASSAAYYSRGGSLVEMFQQSVGRVIINLTLPLLSASAREHDSVGKRQYAVTATVALFSAFGWSAAVFLAVLAEPLTFGFFGTQWAQSIPIGRLLCLVLGLEVSWMFYREALIAYGRIEVASALQLQHVLIRVGCFAIGLHWGLQGAAFGLAAAAVIVGTLVTRRFAAENMIDWVALRFVCARSTLAAFGVGAVSYATLYFSGYNTAPSTMLGWGTIAVAGTLSATVWLATLILTKHPTFKVLERQIRSRGNSES
jgi:O-antigen/teichoic acid export membrane protein